MPVEISDVKFGDGEDVIPVSTSASIEANIEITPPQRAMPTGFRETREENPTPPDELLESYEAAGTKQLFDLLLKAYGHRLSTWEPETIFTVLQDDLDGEISDTLKERILAIRIFMTDRPWTDWVAFEKAAIAVSGGHVDPEMIQYVSPASMAKAIAIMKSLDSRKIFSDEVQRYIAARLHAENHLYVTKRMPEKIQSYLQVLGVSGDLVKMCQKREPELKNMQNPPEPVNLVDLQVTKALSLDEAMDAT